jgi:ParB family chromosome partitioning protein
MKAIIADTSRGHQWPAKVENWVPRWMAFPPSSYTERGGVGSVRAHAKAIAALAPPEEECPEGDGGASPEAPAPQAADGAQVAASGAEDKPAPLAA